MLDGVRLAEFSRSSPVRGFRWPAGAREFVIFHRRLVGRRGERGFGLVRLGWRSFVEPVERDEEAVLVAASCRASPGVVLDEVIDPGAQLVRFGSVEAKSEPRAAGYGVGSGVENLVAQSVDLAEPADALRHNDAVLHWPVLLAEQSNLRTAAAWAIEQRDYPLIVDLARRLWTWLRSTGRIDELRVPVDHVLLDLPEHLAPAQIGALCTIGAYITGLAGDLDKGIDVAERALVHLTRAPDDSEVALLTTAARLTLATLLTSRTAQLDDVLAEFDDVVATSYRLDNIWLLANARSTRGLLRATMGDTVGARRDHEHALDFARTLHDPVMAAQATGLLAMVDILDGRLDAGRERLRVHFDELHRSGSLERLANALDTSAALAVAEHRWDDALLTTTAASDIRTRIRVAPWPLFRPYHDRSARTALARVGGRAAGLVESALSIDPWSIANRTLGRRSPNSSSALST